MRILRIIISLVLIILIVISIRDTYEKTFPEIQITGSAADQDTATVRLFVIANETVVEPIPKDPSGSGGGGPIGPPRRPVNITQKIILELDAPLSETIYAGDEIIILIGLKNRGDVDLRDIILSKTTNAPDISLILSKDFFELLDISEEDSAILKIKSLVKPTAHIGINRYFVTINADVGNYDYSTSIRFFINLKERDYEARLETEKELKFAEGFFNQTPECSDIAKDMGKAWDHYEDSEYNKSRSVMGSAIQKCRDLLGIEGEKEKLAPEEKVAWFVIGIEILIILAIMLALLWYLLRKKKGKQVIKPTEKLKTRLESTFEDLINKTSEHIRRKNVDAARQGYLQLRSLYETLTQSKLPLSTKRQYYIHLLNIHAELSRIMKK